MKFKIDENLPREFAELLRAVGHDALTVLDEGIVGASDVEILVRCQKERRALMTLDLDFSDLRTYPPSDYLGLVVFRVRRQDKKLLMNILSKVTPLLDQGASRQPPVDCGRSQGSYSWGREIR